MFFNSRTELFPVKAYLSLVASVRQAGYNPSILITILFQRTDLTVILRM